MIQAWYEKLQANVSQVILGKEEETRLITATLLAGGHVLLEDVPGTGKTTLARTLAKSLELPFRRVQFTPDMLPSDLTGVNIYTDGRFEFRPGPLFTGLLLADEINRATPKTQSALLEAMAETQITVDGETRTLPEPFLVIATQNPVEMEGTYRLPEAQLDRFTTRIRLGYPSAEAEREMLQQLRQTHPVHGVQSVTTPEEIKRAQSAVRQVKVTSALEGYLVQLIRATRVMDGVALGASPRAALMLQATAQAFAALSGRNYLLPDDIQKVLEPVLAHRLLLQYEARLEGLTAEGVLRDVLRDVAVPVEAEV